jgi:hypothetical protein
MCSSSSHIDLSLLPTNNRKKEKEKPHCLFSLEWLTYFNCVVQFVSNTCMLGVRS